MMNPVFWGALSACGLFLGIFLMIEAGRNIAARQRVRDAQAVSSSLGVLESALFGLMSLVLAFSFSGAAQRFDARRMSIVDEANCIGTAYLRIDVLPLQAQPQLREKFRQYVDTRLAAYRAMPDIAKAKVEINRAQAIQAEIWTKAVEACQQADSPEAKILVLQALNSMFDIANTRYMQTLLHPPPVVFLMLGVLILICSLIAGFEMGFGKARSLIHVAAFAALLAIIFYTIIELEYPRLGKLQENAFDQALVDVRNSMNAGTTAEVQHAQ
jgi:hypothetical protein